MLLYLLKPGLGTLGKGTVFIQGLKPQKMYRQITTKVGWSVRYGGGLLWPEMAFTSVLSSFLQGPVGPAGGPGFPGAPGAKVRALLVESGTPFLHNLS